MLSEPGNSKGGQSVNKKPIIREEKI